jgi:hypothetical protein
VPAEREKKFRLKSNPAFLSSPRELGVFVPEGYYKVDSQDENGVVDSFYYNNAGGRALSGDLAVNSFWTSSIVLGKPDFAHVFYGPLGGGGGAAHEHARTYKHAVILVAK